MKYLRVPLFVVFLIACVIYAVRMPVFVQQVETTDTVIIDENLLKKHVVTLSEDLIPRTCEKPLELEATASYIYNELTKWNANTYLQTYKQGKNAFSNVISSYGPDTAEVIIVGAHYDAYTSMPGADDNASGVAGILELARALSTAKLNTNVLLIAYACEEPPYFAGPGMGSYIHANSLKDRQVKLMISLEMIGYFTAQPHSQNFPIPALAFLYPNKGNFIAVVGETFSGHASSLKSTMNKYTSLQAYSINAPRSLAGIDFSDHRNYWALDFPAVMVTDTAFYRNTNYHTDADTFETLDYRKMREVVFGVYRHVIKLANRQRWG